MIVIAAVAAVVCQAPGARHTPIANILLGNNANNSAFTVQYRLGGQGNTTIALVFPVGHSQHIPFRHIGCGIVGGKEGVTFWTWTSNGLNGTGLNRDGYITVKAGFAEKVYLLLSRTRHGVNGIKRVAADCAGNGTVIVASWLYHIQHLLVVDSVAIGIKVGLERLENGSAERPNDGEWRWLFPVHSIVAQKQ